jgi:hypothetical protein
MAMHPDCTWFMYCALTTLSGTRDTTLTKVYLRNAIKTATIAQRMRILRIIRMISESEMIR